MVAMSSDGAPEADLRLGLDGFCFGVEGLKLEKERAWPTVRPCPKPAAFFSLFQRESVVFTMTKYLGLALIADWQICFRHSEEASLVPVALLGTAMRAELRRKQQTQAQVF